MELRKLQRVIIDALEDVKAQDIRVTTLLSSVSYLIVSSSSPAQAIGRLALLQCQ